MITRWRRSLSRVLAGLVLRRPLTVVAVTAALAALGLLVTVTRLEFHTGRGDLAGSADGRQHLDAWYDAEFEALPERVVVVVQSEAPAAAAALAAELGRRWETASHIEQVVYRIEPGKLRSKALFYLSREELEILARRLERHQHLFRDVARAPGLTDLLAAINREITSGLVGHLFTADLLDDEAVEPSIDLSPLLAVLRQMNDFVAGSRVFEPPWDRFLGTGAGAAARDGFLRSDDRRLLFVLVSPRATPGEFNRFAPALARIRVDIEEVRGRHPDVQVGVTGRAVLEVDEMAAARRDMALAAVISLIGVTLLFVVVFRGIVRPALAALTLVVGVGWSLGFTTVALGHLNILTIAFLPMLIGLGIDYAIHFIARWEEERAAGRRLGAALVRTLVRAGGAIAAAALTTALSFLALLFTGFRGLVELGFVSGSGILLAALAGFTTLPALLVLSERRTPAPASARAGGRRRDAPREGSFLRRRPWIAVAASALLVAVAIPGLRGVRFDFDLLRLQTAGTEAAFWAQRIRESAGRSVLHAELAVASLEEARRTAAVLKTLRSVGEVDSVVSVLPDDQERKQPVIARLRPLVAELPPVVASAGPVDLETLLGVLARIKFKLPAGEAAEQVGSDHEERREARRQIEAFQAATDTMAPGAIRSALGPLQEALGHDLRDRLDILRTSATATGVTVDDLPPTLRTRYLGRTGWHRLFVFPSEDVWNYEALTRFVRDVRSVDADAHGSPVATLAHLRALKEGYLHAALYALPAVGLLAVATFGALGPALLALVPPAVGGLWTVGLMGLLGVPFNPANLLLLPLLIGIGIDSGIYVVHRFQETAGTAGAAHLGSTGRAITASALTTMVAFGSLMLAEHRGLRSLGLVVLLGVGSLLVASLVTLPSLLAISTSRRARFPNAARPATASMRSPGGRTRPGRGMRPGDLGPRET